MYVPCGQRSTPRVWNQVIEYSLRGTWTTTTPNHRGKHAMKILFVPNINITALDDEILARIREAGGPGT